MKRGLELLLATASTIALSNSISNVNAQSPDFPTNGLVRYYNFDEGSGAVVGDSVDSKNINVFGSWAQSGKFNSAFNPNGYYYGTGTNLSGWSGMSINFWLKKTDNWIDYGDIIGTGNTSGGKFYINTLQNGSVFAFIDNGYAPNYNLIFDNNWHMVTLAIENGNQKGYVDSVLEFSKDWNYSFSSDELKLFGGYTGVSPPRPPNNVLNFDELGIWNRVLSSSEVSNLYNNGNGLAYVKNPVVEPLTLSISQGQPIDTIPQINVKVYSPNIEILTVQSADSPGETNWQSLINYIPSCSGTTTFSFPVTESNRFYRVKATR